MLEHISRLVIATCFVALFAVTPVLAQVSGITRTTLQDQDGPSPLYHTLTVKIEIGPNQAVAPHTHAGLENAYVEAGQGEVTIAGKGKQPLQAGDSFAIPAYTIHSVENTGSAKLTIISTYVIDKSAPLSSPAK